MRGLSLRETLLPQLLKGVGYQTAIVGKWNLGHFDPSYFPTARGFDYHYGSYTGSLDHFNHTYYNVHDFHENGKPIYPKGHSCDLHTNKAIELIRKYTPGSRNFLYLAYNTPHLPAQPLEFYYRAYSSIKDETRRRIAAMITHLDASIGKLLDAVEQAGVQNETYIWITSDNGGWTWPNCGGSNYPLRDGKASCYEGGIRVVNMLCGPGLKGKRVDLSHAVDILPTICALAGVDTSHLKLDGVNLLNVSTERTLIYELRAEGDEIIGAVRKGKWKFLNFNNNEELYDLDADPGEQNNLVKVHPEVRDDMIAALRKSFIEGYEADPPQTVIYNRQNGGPPNDFVPPKFWGEFQPVIKLLSYDEGNVVGQLKSISQQSLKELYGYPDDWKIKTNE
jgi:arylsulfatase A-like enzyme